MMLFSQDFKYKVESFNLYIIDRYVKRTIGRRVPQIEKLLAPKPLITFIDRKLFLLFNNLITDRGHLPTQIKSIEFPLLALFIWNRKASKDRSIVQ